MPAAIRIGDPISCGDTMAQGSGNVFVNGIPFSRENIDLTAGHCYPPVPIVRGSPNVFVNSARADRVGDPIPVHCCGDSCHSGNAATGSPNVYVNDGGGQPQTVTVVVERNIQPSVNKLVAAQVIADDPQVAPIYKEYRRIKEKEAGYVSTTQAPTSVETAPPTTKTPAIVPADCSDIEAYQGTFPGSFQLSPNFTLAQVTTDTLVSHYQLRPSQNLTEKQIVCNLRLLCLNIIEPLYTRYGSNFTINSCFRYDARSQHGEGKAVDISFKNLTTEQQWWDRSLELKDAVNYDQLIYEAELSIWWHISWNNGGYSVSRPNLVNRHNTLTKARHSSTYVAGIQRIIT